MENQNKPPCVRFEFNKNRIFACRLKQKKMHPLDKFKHCPVCGSTRFEVHNAKSKHCADCGFTYYFNPSSATVAFILNERGEQLVCRRGKSPAKGTLDLPGGFIDMQETGEEGVAREVREETGLTVVRADYLFSLPNLYEYSGFMVHTLDMFFPLHSGRRLAHPCRGRRGRLLLDAPRRHPHGRLRAGVRAQGRGAFPERTCSLSPVHSSNKNLKNQTI